MLVLEQRGEGVPAAAGGVYVVAMPATQARATRLVRDAEARFIVDLRSRGPRLRRADEGGAGRAGRDSWSCSGRRMGREARWS